MYKAFGPPPFGAQGKQKADPTKGSDGDVKSPLQALTSGIAACTKPSVRLPSELRVNRRRILQKARTAT